MSVWDVHYTALYNSLLAVDAVLTVACGDVPIELRAIDKTVPQMNSFQGADVATIGPAAHVRASELAEKDVDPDTLDGGMLTLNGKDWKIINHQPIPAPTGEAFGEVRLSLDERR